MKKYIFWGSLACLTLSSCHIHETKEIYEINKAGTDIKVVYATIDKDEWQVEPTKTGSYLFLEIPVPDVTEKVMDDGAVLVYFIDEADRDNMLPYVYPVSDGKKILLQNIRFDVGVGMVTMIVEWADGDEYDIMDDFYKFKICILSPGA